MEIKKVDTYTHNKETTIKITENLSRVTSSLSLFLAKLKEIQPDIYDDYSDKFRKRLLSLIGKDCPNFEEMNIPGFNEAISELTELHKLYYVFSFQLLDVPSGYSANTFTVSWYNDDKSFLFPAYIRLFVLCEILGRKDAIAYYQNYVDTVLYERTEANLELNDLDSFWDAEEGEEDHPSYGLGFRANRGKFGFRVDKCVNYDVLKTLNDPELTHVLCCYGDTALFESRNPNFVYTMQKTLMKGDPYCDKCFHDKRHVDRIEHPSDEFWDSLISKHPISSVAKIKLYKNQVS
ncbi:MAG: L-2-amino-thiazoline-4-carboxylic acid hydrolase [Candidatus Kariarchaeaceae archaeon]|jgi:hypothetical protein